MSEYNIVSGFLFVDGKRVPYKESPNVGGVCKPDILVCHDTASGLDEKGPISWLTNPDAKASAHFVVGRDGSITQLVSTDRTAWHAGQSSYNGRAVKNSVNTFSIGIEIVNPGVMTIIKDGRAYFDQGKGASWDMKKFGIAKARALPKGAEAYWMPYTKEQIDAVVNIGKAVHAYYTLKDVVAHWTVSPGRKVDTNPLFPLEDVKNDILSGGKNTTQYQDPIAKDKEVDPNKNATDPALVTTPPENTSSNPSAPLIIAPVQPDLSNVTLISDTTQVEEEDDNTIVSYDKGLVKLDLNLRAWPDSPNILGVIPVGAQIDIERATTSQVTGSVWYKVRVLSKGQLMNNTNPKPKKYTEGFVHSAYIQRIA